MQISLMLPSIRIFLSQKYPLTNLIVRDADNYVGHNGIRETLTEVRRKFWIVKVEVW